MGSILCIDDIANGQMVALHSFVDANSDEPRCNRSAPRSHLRQICMGVPMRVKGISLPFVACELISPAGEVLGPTIVDVRRVRICKLDAEYVNAIISPSRNVPTKPEFDDVPF